MGTNDARINRVYKIITILAAVLHFSFMLILWQQEVYAFSVYNCCSVLFYLGMTVLVRQNPGLAMNLIHVEVCIFALIGTLVLGPSVGFSIYFIALPSLTYFNPFQRKKAISIPLITEILLFCVIQIFLQDDAGMVQMEEKFQNMFRYLNYFCCFMIVVAGTIVSKIAMKHSEEEWKQVTTDELTGMFNSKYFMKRVEQVLKQSKEKYYFICTDISNFSLYNKIYGEDKGDEILKELAKELRQIDYKGAVYGRMFVDEFGILLPADCYEEAYFVSCAESLQERFSSAIYQMRIYIGVYEITDPFEPVKSISAKAKIALDTIEGEYDRNLAYYTEHMLNETIRKQQIVGGFHQALKEGQFCIYLQPQMAADGELLGAEALVRWRHPQEGMVPPGEFIPVLEETSLITSLDRYVWEQAAKLLQKWKQEGREQFYISVNVSAMDFYYVDIYETFTSLVKKYDISPANLKIEITETVLMDDTQKQMKLFNRLREYGFEIELDDFGSGYSSLSMLKDLLVDVIKIDMGFLDETIHQKRSWSILQSIVNMAEKLGIRTITEGVETEQQMQNLLDIGCKTFQGYYFAKPMEVSDFTQKYLSM